MDVENLIDLIRQNELLYNPESNDYGNLRKKEQVWDDIGRQLKRSGKEVSNNLNCQKIIIMFKI